METKLKILFTVLLLTFIQLFCTNNLLAQNNKNKLTEKLLNLTKSLDSTDINLDDFTQAIESGADVNAILTDGQPVLIQLIGYYKKQDVTLKTFPSISIFSDEALLRMSGGLELEVKDNGRIYSSRDIQRRIDQKYHIKQELEKAITVIKLLVNNGANTEWKYSDDKTCLIKAIEEHDLALIKLLLEIGANINQANNYYTYLTTSKDIKKLLEIYGTTFTIRDERYHLKEPFAIELGLMFGGGVEFDLNYDRTVTLYDPTKNQRPTPSLATCVGLNLSIIPAYRFKISNEILFEYKNLGYYYILNVIYAPMFRYCFGSFNGKMDYYFAAGVEYSRNLNFDLKKSAQPFQMDESDEYYGFSSDNTVYTVDPDYKFGVNKSILAPSIGIGLENKATVVEIRYKKYLGEYYTYDHNKQNSVYFLFGIKF